MKFSIAVKENTAVEFHSCVAATGKYGIPMDMRPEPTAQTVRLRFSSGGEGEIVAEDCLTWNDDFRVAIVGYPDLEPLRVGITRHDLMFRGRRVTMNHHCAAEASAPREKRRLNPSQWFPPNVVNGAARAIDGIEGGIDAIVHEDRVADAYIVLEKIKSLQHFQSDTFMQELARQCCVGSAGGASKFIDKCAAVNRHPFVVCRLRNAQTADRQHKELFVIAGEAMHAGQALFERRRRPQRQRGKTAWAAANKIARGKSMLPGDRPARRSLEKEPKWLMTAVHVANDDNG